MNIQQLLYKFKEVRSRTELLCENLEKEDFVVQPDPVVSPIKWHLAHTTWFYEQFVLTPHLKNYKVFDEEFSYLFNSYYNNVGDRVVKTNRGLMSRPCVDRIFEYRAHVTKHIQVFLSDNQPKNLLDVLELGMNHEQQHQELLAYDIKYILGHQPSLSKIDVPLELKEDNPEQAFVSIEEGVYEIGHKGDDFTYDNELGVHKVYIQPFSISNKLVTNKEYIEFIEAGGYQDFNLWHAEGWDFINKHEINAPMYWHKVKGEWKSYTYNGFHALNPNLPVNNLSFYEAYAFAEWKGMRLPTEFEWEVASDQLNWGQLWEWTNSAYLAYPGYSKAEGAIGEYNGKFMVNSHVLRGGSYATPLGHSRKTYRNFFHPESRWQFSGIRLAK